MNNHREEGGKEGVGVERDIKSAESLGHYPLER